MNFFLLSDCIAQFTPPQEEQEVYILHKTTYAADTDKLRGIIAERKLTQKKLAEHLEVDAQTFSNRMKSGKFTNDEITKITLFLDIEDFVSVFFPYLKKR